jgi:hypothetical protein
MKTFRLIRFEDKSGVSGTGLVAEGVQFTAGQMRLMLVAPALWRQRLR